MTVPRWLRQMLWYTAWLLWLPVVGYGISQGNLIAAFVVGLPGFLLSLYFSLARIVCPECKHVMRMVGARVTHCIKCGAKYEVDEPVVDEPVTAKVVDQGVAIDDG